MKSTTFSLVALIGFVAVTHCAGKERGSVAAGSESGSVVATCDSSICQPAAGSGSYGTPQDCTAAGGQCLVGPPEYCAKQGPENTCNCNPGCNPSGAYCCLEFIDAHQASSWRVGGRRPVCGARRSAGSLPVTCRSVCDNLRS
jgi:hypothetical protein